jgi:hypothetical protein
VDRAVNHRARYHAHDVRIRGSLERCVGESAVSEAELMRRARAVYSEGRGVYFTPAQLAAMPSMIRAVIEGEGRRIYAKGGR